MLLYFLKLAPGAILQFLDDCHSTKHKGQHVLQTLRDVYNADNPKIHFQKNLHLPLTHAQDTRNKPNDTIY